VDFIVTRNTLRSWQQEIEMSQAIPVVDHFNKHYLMTITDQPAG
jgi:hypothetical protein